MVFHYSQIKPTQAAIISCSQESWQLQSKHADGIATFAKVGKYRRMNARRQFCIKIGEYSSEFSNVVWMQRVESR